MPNAEARAAFNEAQNLAAELRDTHVQEHAIMDMLKKPLDAPTVESLETELKNVQREWGGLMAAYTQAIGRFTSADEQARKAG